MGSVGTQDHGGLREPRELPKPRGASRIKRTNKPWGQRETGEPASRADGNHKTMGDYKNQGNLKITGDHEDQKNPEKQGNYKYHRT